MSQQKLTIAAQITVKEESVDLVKSELLKLIDITRRQEGCINYDLHQDNSKSNCFLLYEKWESPEFLQKHLGNLYLAEYLKATEGAVKEVVIHEMTQIA